MGASEPFWQPRQSCCSLVSLMTGWDAALVKLAVVLAAVVSGSFDSNKDPGWCRYRGWIWLSGSRLSSL